MTEEVKQNVEAEVVVEEDTQNQKIEFDPIATMRNVLFWFVSRGILSLGVISGVLTLAGFFIIQSYMNSFSSLYSYNINISQYLAAGTSLIIYLIQQITDSLPNALKIAFVGIVIILVWFLISEFIKSKYPHESKTIVNLTRPITNALVFVFRFIYRLSWGFIVFILLLKGFVYGSIDYNKTERWLGGGQPATVILTFNEDQPSNLWSFAINPEQPRLSEPLQLLIELNDGVLVRQAEGYNAVIVKNDVIYGIQDVSRTNSSPLPEPTASPTPSS